MADFARSVQLLVEIAGNPEAKLDAINKKLDEMPKKTVVGSSAPDTVNKLTATTDRATGAFSNLGSKMSSAFGTVKSSLTDLQGSIQNMASSLAGITVGGAVSGLAWLDKAKSNLYVEQMANAVNANKKLGISFDQLKEKAKGEAAAGEDTTTGAMKELFAISTMGQKYVGKGDKALNNADAIGDFYTKHQEMLQEQGIMDAEQMVQRAIMTQGKMGGRFGTKFAMALGVSLDDPSMKTAKSRMKLFMEEGAKVDIKAELDKRPWDQAEVAIRSLKSSIGDSIATPMAFVTTLFADFVKLIAKIPGGSALIGYAGMFLALASAASLVIGVMTPLWTFMKAVNAAMGISTILKAADAGVTVADAGAHAMLTGAMEGEFVATELTTAAQNMSFAARIRLIGATLWDTTARYANSAANLLGIGSLLGLAGAEGIASTGAWALAAGVWAALSPLLPFIAAGAILAGVLVLIADKMGILQPIAEGLSRAFHSIMKGDFSNTWKSISDIKLPSWEDAKKNLTSELNVSYILDKHLGVPLASQVKYLDYIYEVLKKIKTYIDEIISLFYTYIWSPLKGIWDYIKQIVQYFIGGDSLNGQELVDSIQAILTAPSNQEKYGRLVNMANENPEFASDVSKYGSGKMSKSDLRTKYGLSDWEIKDLEQAYSSAKSPKSGMLNQGVTQGVSSFVNSATQNVGDTLSNWLFGDTIVRKEDANGQQYYSETDSSGNTRYYKNKTLWEGLKDEEVTDPTQLESVKKLLDTDSVPKNALGGEVTKSGLAIVDEGEPIVPAEVARSSNLIDLLSTLASSSNNINSMKSNQIIINFEYSNTGTNSNGMYFLDKFAFERAVKEIVGKVTRQYGSY